MLNPIAHTASPSALQKYKKEPYVVAADIYSAELYTGLGGWSWYTGSSGWLYRVGVEAILGLTRAGRHLEINPCIPKSWPSFSLDYRFGSSLYRIHDDNPNHASKGVKTIHLDGTCLPTQKIPLADDAKTHEVVVSMGV